MDPAPEASTAGAPVAARTEFAALFERERLPMLRLATLLVGSAAVAEEVVQDAFAAVDVRWDELDRPGGYLRTTVVNGARGVLRRRRVEERYREQERAEPDASVDDGHAPLRLVELRDALDRLGDRQRVVIVLRYFVDLPDDEIAALLKCRPATVRSLARRGLAVLREDLT